MKTGWRRVAVSVAHLSSFCLFGAAPAPPSDVEIGEAAGVTFVGAFNRWISTATRASRSTQCQIDAPQVDAIPERRRRRVVFSDLAPGTYDLVIMRRTPADRGLDLRPGARVRSFLRTRQHGG